MVERGLDSTEVRSSNPRRCTNMYDYKIVKVGPAMYSLIRMDESFIRGYTVLFDGKSKQECLDMYNKNFERPYSTLKV